MATIRLRSVLLRSSVRWSLPALLLLVLFVAAPRSAPVARPAAAHAAAAAEVAAEQSDTGSQHTADARRAPADRTTVLIAQCSAGVRGSRAPPFAA